MSKKEEDFIDYNKLIKNKKYDLIRAFKTFIDHAFDYHDEILMVKMLNIIISKLDYQYEIVKKDVQQES